MKTSKMHAGVSFPALHATGIGGETVDIGKPGPDADWRIVFVYRGAHCPMCTRYLNKLEEIIEPLAEIGVDVVAVSADSKEQLEGHLEELDVSFPFYCGLTLEQMDDLGLYISDPRSEQETDHRFPEPGMFVINANGALQVVDISNNPFSRPEIDILLSGLQFIKDPGNDCPIRGTYRS